MTSNNFQVLQKKCENFTIGQLVCIKGANCTCSNVAFLVVDIDMMGKIGIQVATWDKSQSTWLPDSNAPINFLYPTDLRSL